MANEGLETKKRTFSFMRTMEAMARRHKHVFFCGPVMKMHEVHALSKAIVDNSDLDILRMESSFGTVTERTDAFNDFSPVEVAGGDDGAIALAYVLEAHQTLSELHLDSCNIGPKGAKALAKGLKASVSMNYLFLTDNNIGDLGAIELAKTLKHLDGLSGLCLYQNNIHSEGATAMFNAMKHNHKVVWLRLKRNDIGPTAGEALGEALKVNKTLETINIAHCNVGDKGTVAIAKALKTNSTVATLKLSANKIGVVGAIAVAAYLKTNGTMENLKLCMNAMGNNGVATIAAALKKNHTLTILGIADNEVTWKGAKALAECLEVNTSLVRLEMEDNPIGTEGAISIAKALYRNTSLDEINLQTCSIREEGGIALSKMLGYNNSLTQLMLSMNYLSNERRFEIRRKLDSNRKEYYQGHKLLEVSSKNIEWSRCRIAVLGDQRSGKSALVRSLLGWKHDKTYRETKATTQYNVTLSYARTWRLSEGDTFKNRHGAKLYFMAKKMRLPDKYRERIGMNVVEYGIDCIKCNMHQLLLSNFGIHLVVFDMRQMLSNPEKSRDRLSYWLSMFALRAPGAKLAIVGTGYDSVCSKSEIATVNAAVLMCIPTSKNLKVMRNRALIFFPVDNVHRSGVAILRECVSGVMCEPRNGNVSIPIKWISGFEALRLKQQKGGIIKLQVVKEYLKKWNIASRDELKSFLSFFHNAGELVYITKTERLGSCVMMNPTYLVKEMNKVLSLENLHELSDEWQHIGLGSDFALLQENSLISRDMLEYLWEKHQVSFMIELMSCLYNFSHIIRPGDDDFYLIPTHIASRHRDKATTPKGLQCDFRFVHLPDGLFERLVTLWYEYTSKFGSGSEPYLSKNYCHLTWEDRGKVSFTKTGQTLRMVVENSGAAAECLGITSSILRKANTAMLDGRLSYKVFVEYKDRVVPFNVAKSKSDCPWIHTKRARRRSTKPYFKKSFML